MRTMEQVLAQHAKISTFLYWSNLSLEALNKKPEMAHAVNNVAPSLIIDIFDCLLSGARAQSPGSEVPRNPPETQPLRTHLAS